MARTDIFEVKFTAKEIGTLPVLEVEWMQQTQGDWKTSAMNGTILFLEFEKSVTIDEAQAAAKDMNRRFKSMHVLSVTKTG